MNYRAYVCFTPLIHKRLCLDGELTAGPRKYKDDQNNLFASKEDAERLFNQILKTWSEPGDTYLSIEETKK